jgi:hypothetical protein
MIANIPTVEQLIQRHVHFKLGSTGWLTGKCPLCNDYKDRAGFKFSSDGGAYNCFNCSTTARFVDGQPLSKKMREILLAFGATKDELSEVSNAGFFRPVEKNISLASVTQINTDTPTVNLPKGSMRLGHSEFIDYQVKLVQYLISRRIPIDSYPFYFSLEEKMLNRIIIPYYRNGNIIYWQARSIDPLAKRRYENCPASKEAAIFNMDRLNHHSDGPLFVCEGVFDAFICKGVAILGSKLTAAKKQLLAASRRRLVFVIDKDQNGAKLGMDALSNGWEIVFVPNGAADINKSAERFGSIWTINELMKNITSGDDAYLQIKLKCK